jgi:hypothetical protein
MLSRLKMNSVKHLHETGTRVKFPTRAPRRCAARRSLFALATVAVGFAAATEAPEMPALRQGLWSYQRVAETAGHATQQPVSMSKCVDPSADLKKNLEQLRARNCTVSAFTRTGNAYAWTVACPLNGETLQIRSVITVENDTAFREEMNSHFGSQDSRSSLSARRVGDCPEAAPPWLHHRPARPLVGAAK